MTVEEIAMKLCQHTYLKLAEQDKAGVGIGYSLEKYWDTNKKFFMERAEIYCEVKTCLEAK
jgi:hypothetical protein